MQITLSREDFQLLCEALDSHVYWQLSEPEFRHSGYVRDPGSEDEDAAAEIVAAQALEARLSALLLRND
jgi:hypothetical protein